MSSPTLLDLPLHFDFTADPRGYDWQVVMVNDNDPSSTMCQVSVNFINGDLEYDLKRELQDRLVECMGEEWRRWVGTTTEEMDERPYYKEDFDFGELDDRVEEEGEGSLTELIHERLDDYFDNTFDLSDWVNRRVAHDHSTDYTDLNQYCANDGTLYNWFVEALEHHAGGDDIYEHFCDENLTEEIWGQVRENILEWIDKTYKPKTIDELREENKTLKAWRDITAAKMVRLRSEAMARQKQTKEIETLKKESETLKKQFEHIEANAARAEDAERSAWMWKAKAAEWENTTMNYRRLMDEIDAEVPEEERNDEWIGSGTIQGLLEYIERIRKENAEAKE